MRNKIILIVLLILQAIFSLWSQKVGINTETPEFDLDIHGTDDTSDGGELQLATPSQTNFLRFFSGRLGDHHPFIAFSDNDTFHIVTTLPDWSTYTRRMTLLPTGNIGIGISPDPSAILEVQSTNQGVLVPRIQLVSESVSDPVENPVISLLVYNTNNSLSKGEGFYYWTGTRWASILSQDDGVPTDGIILSESRTDFDGFNYDGYHYISDYTQYLGQGQGQWLMKANIPTVPGASDMSCIWTGDKLLAWSGRWGSTYLYYPRAGGIYDPGSNIWTVMDTTFMPEGRFGNATVYDPDSGLMVVFGGIVSGDGINAPFVVTPDGGVYDYLNDNWWSDMTLSPLAGRAYHTGVSIGSNKMIFWGGQDMAGTYFNDGVVYDVTTNSWTPIASSGLAPRSNHSAIWTGTEMIIWGGVFGGGYFSDGAKYNPITDTWTTLSSTGNPIGRFDHTAIWTGTEMIIWGGSSTWGGANYKYGRRDGGRYNPVTNTWSPMQPAPGEESGSLRHAAIWTGTEMIVSGGRNLVTVFSLCRSWNPTTDSWKLYTNMPEPLYDGVMIWTGDSMLAVGGCNGVEYPAGYPGYSPLTFALDTSSIESNDVTYIRGKLFYYHKKD